MRSSSRARLILCSYGNQVDTWLWSCGHTCTDLGIPIAGEVEEKEELKNLLKLGNNWSQNFHKPKKLEIANFNSSQKVPDFRFLNGTINHVIVDGAVSSNLLLVLTH